VKFTYLATDEFTRKGMNWASDRVKKTKKILKEMNLIEVVQHRKYYYVHLFFIYTKKKVCEILGISSESKTSQKIEPLVVKKEEEKKSDIKEKISTKTETTVSPVLTKWIEYCDKNDIQYKKNNIKYWEKKLFKRTTFDQQQAVYNAINKKWKDFYIVSTKASRTHKFLGKNLMMEKDCDVLLDISYRDNKFVYQFKNTKVITTAQPYEIFDKYGYQKSEVKTAPIVSKVQDRIMGLIKRF